DRAVDLEQGGGLALFHLAHQGGLILVGRSGHDGDGHASLGGVLGGQVLPGFVLLGLEVQVVDLAGSGGRGAAGRASSRAGGGGGGSRRAAGRTTGGQNTGSGHRTGGLQEVAAGNHVFHRSSPLFVLGLSRVYAARPGGTGMRQSDKRAAPLAGRTLSPSWRAGARTTVWAGAPCSICRISSSTQRVAISSVGWTIEARAGTQKRDMGMPSKPITDTSSGTLYPALARARMTQMAMTSLMAKTAVDWGQQAVHGVVGRFKIVVGQAVQPGIEGEAVVLHGLLGAQAAHPAGVAGGRAADHADLAVPQGDQTGDRLVGRGVVVHPYHGEVGEAQLLADDGSQHG